MPLQYPPGLGTLISSYRALAISAEAWHAALHLFTPWQYLKRPATSLKALHVLPVLLYTAALEVCSRSRAALSPPSSSTSSLGLAVS